MYPRIGPVATAAPAPLRYATQQVAPKRRLRLQDTSDEQTYGPDVKTPISDKTPVGNNSCSSLQDPMTDREQRHRLEIPTDIATTTEHRKDPSSCTPHPATHRTDKTLTASPAEPERPSAARLFYGLAARRGPHGPGTWGALVSGVTPGLAPRGDGPPSWLSHPDHPPMIEP